MVDIKVVKTLRPIALVSGVLLALSLGVFALAEGPTKTVKPPTISIAAPTAQPDLSNPPQLPDEDSYVASLISTLGGLGGGGLILVFFLRRFIQNYDETIKKWETRVDQINEKYDESIALMWERWTEKYDRLGERYDRILEEMAGKWEAKNEKALEAIAELKSSAQELKYEAARLRENMVSKDVCLAEKHELYRLTLKVEALEKRLTPNA